MYGNALRIMTVFAEPSWLCGIASLVLKLCFNNFVGSCSAVPKRRGENSEPCVPWLYVSEHCTYALVTCGLLVVGMTTDRPRKSESELLEWLVMVHVAVFPWACAGDITCGV